MTLKLHPSPRNPVLGEEDQPAEGIMAPFEGSDEGEDVLKLLGLPSNRSMIGVRDLPSGEEAGPAVHAELGRVRQALEAAVKSGAAWRRRIDGLSPQDRQTFLDALGHGEVSVIIEGADGEGEAQILETVLPGVWVGRAHLTDGTIGSEWVEVGNAPRVLRELALTRPKADIPIEALTAPRGAMNVMSVLAEARQRSIEWMPGDPNHVMNFTLFPMTPADSAYLAKVLGESGVRISSGGYGAARVVMTGLRHVWAVQYLNGLGAVILDTLEIGDLPDAVLASPEDFEDSAVRLSDMLEAYAP